MNGARAGARQLAENGSPAGDGITDTGKTLHVYPGASQRSECLYCGAILDGHRHRRGKPQEFCREKPCRRLFWQEARRVGGRALRRRRLRAARALGRRPQAFDSAAGRQVAFLIAAGAVALGIGIPDVAR